MKKLDPTGTPVAARLLRPATMLQAKYEALSAADPMKGLVMQVGGSLLILKLVEKSLKKLGEPTATLVARVAYGRSARNSKRAPRPRRCRGA